MSRAGGRIRWARNDRQARWDRRFLALAQYIAQWSKDPSTQVGAVLIRPNNSIASTGYNGFPPGHDDSPELYADREYKYRHVTHAERNAINFLASTEDDLRLYTSFPCCPDCMAAAGEAGVVRVVFPPVDYKRRDANWITEWDRRIDESLAVAGRYNIEVTWIDV